MRKISIFLLLATVFSFFGCTDSDDVVELSLQEKLVGGTWLLTHEYTLSTGKQPVEGEQVEIEFFDDYTCNIYEGGSELLSGVSYFLEPEYIEAYIATGTIFKLTDSELVVYGAYTRYFEKID